MRNRPSGAPTLCARQGFPCTAGHRTRAGDIFSKNKNDLNEAFLDRAPIWSRNRAQSAQKWARPRQVEDPLVFTRRAPQTQTPEENASHNINNLAAPSLFGLGGAKNSPPFNLLNPEPETIKNNEKSWFLRFQKSISKRLRNDRGSLLSIRGHSLGIPESILGKLFFMKNHHFGVPTPCLPTVPVHSWKPD